jgi:hypothetical protein
MGAMFATARPARRGGREGDTRAEGLCFGRFATGRGCFAEERAVGREPRTDLADLADLVAARF